MVNIDSLTCKNTMDSPGPHCSLAIEPNNESRHDPSSWPVFLDQESASAFLVHVCGVRLAPKSLQKRRVVGGSPPFQKIGSRVAYPRDPLKAWGDAQAGPVVHSTSELSPA